MPESNGTSIMEDNEHAMHFLFKDDGLKKCVESHYPHLQLDRTKITITAESAGAFLAWDAYRKFGCHFNGLYFRYGLFEPYNRLPGEYMGKEVSFGEAANSLSKSRSLTRRLNEEIPPGIGRPTPISQWAALYLSVTGYWQLIWGRNSPMDSLDEMSSCPNSNMVILFMHGFKDTFSPLDSPQRMVEKLKKWPVDVVLHVLEEEGHGFDYNISLDSPKMKPFAEFARKIDGSSQVAR
jgi:pimeloyl-ACP methyl ester carboxylesterase